MLQHSSFFISMAYFIRLLRDQESKRVLRLRKMEYAKTPKRHDIINYLLGQTKRKHYLEIGVRNPDHNFNKILCANKYSVDPGYEYQKNPVSYKYTSDIFFNKLNKNQLDIPSDIRFDVIFLDGLHQSYQLERDILNAIQFIDEKGFIVLHDCNPPSEYHARENFDYKLSPARDNWNGTSWKAFYKFRHRKDLFSACIDTDWGVGILSRHNFHNKFNHLAEIENPYFEFSEFEKNKIKHLNLLAYTQLIQN